MARVLVYLASSALYKALATVPVTSFCINIIATPTYLQLLPPTHHDHDVRRDRSDIIGHALKPHGQLSLGRSPSD